MQAERERDGERHTHRDSSCTSDIHEGLKLNLPLFCITKGKNKNTRQIHLAYFL